MKKKDLKRHLNLNDVWYYFLFLFLACLGIVSCFQPSDHLEFSEPLSLKAFLTNHIQKLPGQTVHFQILSMQGEPIPYGLLKFQWVEGGRMSFQTDQDGILSMQFERDILEYEVNVSPESAKAKLRVTW